MAGFHISALMGIVVSMLFLSPIAWGEDDASHLGQQLKEAPEFQPPFPIVYDLTYQPIPDTLKEVHFTLKGVDIHSLPIDMDFSSTIQSHLQQEMDFTKLHSLAQKITNALRRQGHLLSMAFLSTLEIKDGIVNFHIIQDSIHTIITEGDKDLINEKVKEILDKIKANPKHPGGFLEHNLMLIDQLAGVDIAVRFKTATAPNQGIDMYVTFTKDPSSFGGAIDNDLNSDLGSWQASLMGTINNFFGINDAISLLGAHSFDEKNMEYISSSIQIPLNIDGLYVNIDGEFSRTYPWDNVTGIRTRDTYQAATVGLNYPFILKQHKSLEGSISLTASQGKSYNRNEVSLKKDNLRIVSAAMTWNTTDPWGNLNILMLSISKGLRILGATGGHTTDKLRSFSDPGYILGSLNLHRQQVLSKEFFLDVEVIAQLAGNTLPSDVLFSIGGAPNNRPYPEDIISTDSALVARITLNKTITSSDSGKTKLYGYITQSYGWNRTPDLDEQRYTALGGMGIGFSHSLKEHIEGFIEYAIPFRKTVWGTRINNKLYLGIRAKL